MNAPFKLKEGQVLEAPEHELWMRAADNVHRTANDIVEAVSIDIGWVDLACIGATCVNQAMKSLAVARERIRRHGFDLTCQPWFSTITDDKDRERTRLMIRVTRVPA